MSVPLQTSMNSIHMHTKGFHATEVRRTEHAKDRREWLGGHQRELTKLLPLVLRRRERTPVSVHSNWIQGFAHPSCPLLLPSCPLLLPSCPLLLLSCPLLLPSCLILLPSCPLLLPSCLISLPSCPLWLPTVVFPALCSLAPELSDPVLVHLRSCLR